jgi:hypothetical protein
MGQLLFSKCFWNAIHDGTKRTTIRRWRTARLKAGQRAFTPGVGWLIIESVEQIDDLAGLGDADARADGFETIEQMRQALAAIYPSQAGDGRQWFRVAFHCEHLKPGSKPSRVKKASAKRPTSRSTSKASLRRRRGTKAGRGGRSGGSR